MIFYVPNKINHLLESIVEVLVIVADSQGRGNSGVFLLGRYEAQTLDGYQDPTLAAAIYGQYPPLANACVAPSQWHAYDIVFESPIFKNGKRAGPGFAQRMRLHSVGARSHLRGAEVTNEIRQLPKGYRDTPLLPNAKWRVHDVDRPAPPVVRPPTTSTQERAGEPPSDAVVLFDGTSLDAWAGPDGSAAKWKLVDGNAMEVAPRTGNIHTRQSFGSCQLHVEWRAPTAITADSQGRGNSGVFLLGRYEVQVLDGYQNPTYADGLAAAIYGQYPPLVNACVAPGQWHAYDIVFESPLFKNGKLAMPAHMTVLHNGLLVQHRQRIQGPTKHRELASYDEPHGPAGPLMLQDHGDRVGFRNIWIRPIERFEAQ